MSLIDKLAWIRIENRKVLFNREVGEEAFYLPCGKREEGESDADALIREIQEELGVALVPDTIVYLEQFTAQAHGKPEGVMVRVKCFSADFVGEFAPTGDIEELAWLASVDMHRTSVTGELVLTWLKQKDLID